MFAAQNNQFVEETSYLSHVLQLAIPAALFATPFAFDWLQNEMPDTCMPAVDRPDEKLEAARLEAELAAKLEAAELAARLEAEKNT